MEYKLPHFWADDEDAPRELRDLIGRPPTPNDNQWRAGSLVHPGLLLEKYLPYRLEHNTIQEYNQEKDQGPHLNRVRAANAKAKTLYSAVLGQRQQFINDLGTTITECVTSISVMVADSSRAGVVENASLTMHAVYGFPYLKGESLKGVASSWAERENKPSTDRDRIFGTSSSGVGSVEFLDAWPEAWPDLVVLDSAVHFTRYYSEAGEAPHDSMNPVPFSYLAVAPGTKFNLVLRQSPGAPNYLGTAMEWLKTGLCELGYGGKTGSAHGYME